jgi:hypothetical protein
MVSTCGTINHINEMVFISKLRNLGLNYTIQTIVNGYYLD